MARNLTHGVKLSADQSHLNGMGYTLPQAADTRTGEPQRFSHKPGTLVLDPDDYGQGTVIDVSKMTKRSVNAARAQGFEGVNLLKLFAVDNKTKPARRDSDPSPLREDMDVDDGDRGYVVPKATSDGGQLTVNRNGDPVRAVSAEEFLREEDDSRQRASVRGIVEEIASLDEHIPDQVAVTRRPSSQQAEQQFAAVGQVLDEFCRDLKIPCLITKLGKPVRADEVIIFHLEGFGAMSARYHQVLWSGKSLVLIYDTRYVDGNQFLPQASETPIRVTVPHLGKEFPSVVSSDIRFAFGVFDVVVLIVDSENPPVDVKASRNV